MTQGPQPAQLDPTEVIVSSDAPRIRVPAGPGTGKSYNLKRRVKRLLEAGVPGPQIFAVTFTRAAAAELVSSLTTLGVPGAEQVRCGTLHSYAFKLLRRADVFESIRRHARPLWDVEFPFMVSDLAATNGGILATKKMLKALDAAWAQFQHQPIGQPQSDAERKFRDEYLQWMRFHEAIQVGELVYLAVDYLRGNPEDSAHQAFEHVLVDEFQDLNKVDQALVNTLGKRASMVVIGDADQSIYSFRHAHPEGILEWLENEQVAPKEDVPLSLCRRCPQRVVRMANSLIAHNPSNQRTILRPDPAKPEGDVVIIQWPTRAAETNGLAEGISALVNRGQVPADQKVIVIVPNWHWAKALRAKLEAKGHVSVQLLNNADLPDTPAALEALALLKLRANPSDRVALRMFLGANHNGLGNPWYLRLYKYCLENNRSPFDVLANRPAGAFVGCDRLYVRFAELRTRQAELGEVSPRTYALAVLDSVPELQGLKQALAAELAADANGGELDVALHEVLLSPQSQEITERIAIMTPHKAKGLTAHTVVVASAVFGLWPRFVPGQAAEERSRAEAESRRLFYVAVTRPTHRLVISSFTKTGEGDARTVGLALRAVNYNVRTQASQFVAELGPDSPPSMRGQDWIDALRRPAGG